MTSGLILPNIPFIYWGIEFKIDEYRITGIKLPKIFNILGMIGDYNAHLDANQHKTSLFAWVFDGFGHDLESNHGRCSAEKPGFTVQKRARKEAPTWLVVWTISYFSIY